MRSEELDPIRTALAWLAEGRSVALATVVETWGSAPRRPGSHMAMEAGGDFAGSVSGGCVEVAVVEEARGVLADASDDPGGGGGSGGRAPAPFRDLTFGVADDDAWAVGLACGGTVRVVVHRVGPGPGAVAPELLEEAAAAEAGGPPAVLAFDLASGSVGRAVAGVDAPAEAVDEALRTGRSGPARAGDGAAFLRPYVAPVRLVVVGAVHVAQPLVALARVLGWEVSVVDPREAFARPERFPGVTLVPEWPAEGLARVGMDRRTAVVALTHDPKLDDPALRAALDGPAFYVGALGSRRTHGKRRERLGATGMDPSDLDRIHAPIGLDLGGRAPEEIAVSILAEIVAVLRGGGAASGG